ncbi:MAG: hypothetical protein K5928_04850 [Prevotella sp.]|nr:hypothetical protein [Prevotella sp.]
MKKAYQKPQAYAEAADLGDMIAASIEEGFNLDQVEETTETSGNLARRSSIWDDDDE